MDFRIFDLMTFIAERLRIRSGFVDKDRTFFNEIDFVTKEYDKILLKYDKKSKPEVYGGLADNRQNYGYIRLLFNKVDYNQERGEKHLRKLNACTIDAYPNYQYYINIEAKIVLVAYDMSHDILEAWLRQTLFTITSKDVDLFNPKAIDGAIEINPVNSFLNSYEVAYNEASKEDKKNNNIKVIDGLTFYSMDVDINYLWRFNDCNLIDLCNPPC